MTGASDHDLHAALTYATHDGVALQGGMYGNKRFTTDLDQPLSKTVALRVNGMFEDSDSFRDAVGLRRYGITPTIPSGTWAWTTAVSQDAREGYAPMAMAAE